MLLLWFYLFVSTLSSGSEGQMMTYLNESDEWHNVYRRSIRKITSIGGTEILECEINYPDEMWEEHIITWRKQEIEVPVFIQYQGYPPHIDDEYKGRLRLIEQASVEISQIRITDEGWYECSIVFLGAGEKSDSNTNGTWIYLSVDCE